MTSAAIRDPSSFSALYCSLGRTYFHNDIWGLRASLEPGLGNYATDLVRGAAAARGVKLSEVEPDSEAV